MHPAMRTALHTWFRLTRPLTLGVRGAVLDGAGRVMLVRHGYTAGWHLPGGGVEVGETVLAALARELDEEAAITVTGAPALHGVFFNGHASRRDHVIVYVVRSFAAGAPHPPSREIAEAAFHPLDALPAGATCGTRARLEEIASGRDPSADW